MTNDPLLEWPRILKKQYARRTLEGYRSPYFDPFEYRPISEIKLDEVFRLMELASTEIAPYESLTTQEKFDNLVEFAGTEYRPEQWLIAYHDGIPIGYVFPQRYDDVPKEGSIFDIAILPEFRGKGYGKILHAKGMEILATIGVTNYVGSTEIENNAMIAIFSANGCKLSAIRTIEVDEDGNQKILS